MSSQDVYDFVSRNQGVYFTVVMEEFGRSVRAAALLKKICFWAGRVYTAEFRGDNDTVSFVDTYRKYKQFF